MPNFKEGVVWVAMHPEIETALESIDRTHVRLAKRCAIVTSARDGTHSIKSLHYSGRAIDLRTNDLTKPVILAVLAELVRTLKPLGFDVVLEANHIHLEYDPTWEA